MAAPSCRQMSRLDAATFGQAQPGKSQCSGSCAACPQVRQLACDSPDPPTLDMPPNPPGIPPQPLTKSGLSVAVTAHNDDAHIRCRLRGQCPTAEEALPEPVVRALGHVGDDHETERTQQASAAPPRRRELREMRAGTRRDGSARHWRRLTGSLVGTSHPPGCSVRRRAGKGCDEATSSVDVGRYGRSRRHGRGTCRRDCGRRGTVR